MRGSKLQNSASEVLLFSVYCISNTSMMFLKLLTQSKHWQLSYIEAYFSWWTFSLRKSWQRQLLSQIIQYKLLFYIDFWEEITFCVSPRIRNKATINGTHPPCKSRVINTDHALSISVRVCRTGIIIIINTYPLLNKRQEKTVFWRSVELQRTQASLDHCPTTSSFGIQISH